ELEAITAAAPQPPIDFRREADFKCTCGDCRELKQFLADPTASEHRFAAAQARRDHLKNEIRYGECDVDCTTDKSTRPYVLVCTKNTASHERRVKQHKEDLKHLAEMRSLRAKY